MEMTDVGREQELGNTGILGFVKREQARGTKIQYDS